MKIQGLVFDMDGTMFDTEIISAAAMRHSLDTLGLSLTQEEIFQCMGLPGRVIRDRLFARFGPDFAFDTYLERKIAYQNAVIDQNGVPLKKGLLPLLQYAKEAGITCAVATSTSRGRALPLIRRSGTEGYFISIICGEDTAIGKPAPDIYLLAAKRLGLKPEHCAGIEDSKNGILSVRRAGMFSVLVPDMIVPDAEMQNAADLMCDSLLDVLTFFKQLT